MLSSRWTFKKILTCKFTYILNLNFCCGSHIILQVYHVSLHKQIHQHSLSWTVTIPNAAVFVQVPLPKYFYKPCMCLSCVRLLHWKNRKLENSSVTLVWCQVQEIAAQIFVWLMYFLIFMMLTVVSVVSPLRGLVFKQNNLKLVITVSPWC